MNQSTNTTQEFVIAWCHLIPSYAEAVPLLQLYHIYINVKFIFFKLFFVNFLKNEFNKIGFFNSLNRILELKILVNFINL